MRNSFIEDYCAFTSGLTSPYIFRLWSAITTVSAALDRKCFAHTPHLLYANLIVTLVAGPGIGKSNTISLIRGIAQDTGVVPVSPTDMTREAMIDVLADTKEPVCKRRFIGEDASEYHSLFLCIAELGVFIKENDLHLLSTLCSLYDCDTPAFEEVRRGRGATVAEKTLRIPNPQITMLAGVTPGHLEEKFPAEAWQMGFMARNILIYSNQIVKPELFGTAEPDKAGRVSLIRDLQTIGNLEGEFKWTGEAQERIKNWVRDDYAPLPTHPRLHHYNTRRLLQILKLSLIIRASRIPKTTDKSLRIGLPEVEDAFHVLFAAEQAMGGIFTEMKGKSDVQVLGDLYAYLWVQSKAGTQEVHESRFWTFLQGRALAWQIDKLINTMVQSNLAERTLKNPKMYKIKPKQETMQ